MGLHHQPNTFFCTESTADGYGIQIGQNRDLHTGFLSLIFIRGLCCS